MSDLDTLLTHFYIESSGASIIARKEHFRERDCQAFFGVSSETLREQCTVFDVSAQSTPQQAIRPEVLRPGQTFALKGGGTFTTPAIQYLQRIELEDVSPAADGWAEGQHNLLNATYRYSSDPPLTSRGIGDTDPIDGDGYVWLPQTPDTREEEIPAYVKQYTYSNATFACTIPRRALFLHQYPSTPNMIQYAVIDDLLNYTGQGQPLYNGQQVFQHPLFGGLARSHTLYYPGTEIYWIGVLAWVSSRVLVPSISQPRRIFANVIPALAGLGVLAMLVASSNATSLVGRRRRKKSCFNGTL